jgi:beta-RFAP synthase
MTAIEVESPARLHLGFIDPNGSAGRRFGSLGLTLDGLSTRVRLSRATSQANAYVVASDVARPELARAQVHLERLRQSCNYSEPLSLELLDAIPAHAGLGSGTQLALALGYAMTRLAGCNWSTRQIAALTDRGNRSGIGIGAFEQGGFIVDGGRGAATEVPPVISRLPFPANWRVILLFDQTFAGVHGDAEIEAFRRLPPFTAASAGRLAQLTLMNVLPGLAEADFPLFGRAISEIQAAVGDHFAPAQGGRFASRNVARWLDWFAARGSLCFGQSSWGPTGFVITASADEANALLHAAKSSREVGDPVRFRTVSGRNAGARINESTVATQSLNS